MQGEPTGSKHVFKTTMRQLPVAEIQEGERPILTHSANSEVPTKLRNNIQGVQETKKPASVE